MKSKELQAFDLSGESQEQREAYGDNSFGQGCLLARRLVDSGVRFVEVKHDGWDHHKALADEMSEIAPVFDQAFTALITDLEQRGMLDSTLVVVATEFGRKPDFSGDGRSHHPFASQPFLPVVAPRRVLFTARVTMPAITQKMMPSRWEHFTRASHTRLVWTLKHQRPHLPVAP